MAQQRTYGALHASGENLYELEKYHNDTGPEVVGLTAALDPIVTTSLHLPVGARAEARVWRFDKDPWQFFDANGHVLVTLEQIRCSAFTADDHDDGTRCGMILRLDWTSHGGEEKRPGAGEVPLMIRAVDEGENEVLRWDVGRLAVDPTWERRPLSFMQDIDPSLFGRIRRLTLYLFVFRGRLYEC
jgi:hypothetical protein